MDTGLDGPAWGALVKELQDWAEEHRAQGHTAWLHRRSPQDTDALCFTCHETPEQLIRLGAPCLTELGQAP